MSMDKDFKMVATTLFGLENVLATELKKLGAQDVKEGVIASKIAAHAADIAKGVKGAKERDNKMAAARKKLDWEKQIELALAPEKLRESREKHNQTLKAEDACTMCGSYCAMKIVDQQLS